jgi:hypothetical protein
MRVSYAAVVLVAVVAGASNIQANDVSTGPAGIDPLAVRPAISGGIVLGPTGIHRAPNSGGRAVGVSYPYGLPRTREKETRLAQIVPKTATPEATSGNPAEAPFKWVGMLIIPNPTTQSPNQIGMCSGQFIRPNVVLTAGHCIKDLQTNPTGPWPDPTQGTFWLQYQNDQGAPFKILCAETNPLYTLPSNYSSMTTAQQNAAVTASWQHDFAMVLVDGTSPTGQMSYALDWKGKVTQVLRVGYPADILGGAIVQQVTGSVFFSNDIPMGSASSPNIVVQWGPVTDFTQGSSGGAWVAQPSSTEGASNNILVAVTSFNDLAFPGAMFAAYLTAAEFNPLLTSVSNGCK